MRQQERHLMRAQRPLKWIKQFVPVFLRRWNRKWTGNKLVPGIQIVSALGPHRAGENVKKGEGASGLPSAKIAGGAAAPQVRCEAATRIGNLSRDLDDDLSLYAGFFFGELRSEASVMTSKRLNRGLECLSLCRKSIDLEILPVGPVSDESGIKKILIQDDVGHREKCCNLRTGVGGKPVVRHARGIGEARIHHGELRARHLAFDDALRVRIEIMPRLEVGREQQNEARVGMVR